MNEWAFIMVLLIYLNKIVTCFFQVPRLRVTDFNVTDSDVGQSQDINVTVYEVVHPVPEPNEEPQE